MSETGEEELQATARSHRADRAEAIATLLALLWVSTVAIVFAVYGGNVSLVGFLAIAPFIAAAFARPSRASWSSGCWRPSSRSSSARRRTATAS